MQQPPQGDQNREFVKAISSAKRKEDIQKPEMQRGKLLAISVPEVEERTEHMMTFNATRRGSTKAVRRASWAVSELQLLTLSLVG